MTSTEEKQSAVKKKNNEHDADDDQEYDFITVPPDGGYGWVILIACFMINLIVDGFLYAFGAISRDLREHHQCKEWEVTLVSSLACGFYLLSAPIASALCNKFGCRPIGIIGSIIGAGSIALSIISPNIYVMWLLFGFIGGTGLGLLYLPSIVMVGYYFEEKRAIATGIVTAGTGIGSITFGPLSRYLFDRYQWKIGLAILSGILLFCAACCALMRPLKPVKKLRLLTSDNKANDGTSGVGTKDPKTKQSARKDSVISRKSRQSITAEDATRPLYKEDVLYQGDTKDLPEYQAHQDVQTYIQNTTNVPETEVASPMKSFWDVFLSMTNIHLLKDKRMVIICLANVCSMIGYYTPYLFLVKTAEELSIDSDSAVLLLSMIGITNTATRFTSGLITKIPHLSPLLVHNFGLTIAGIVTLFVPMCKNYPMFVAYAIIWGAFIAFHISLSPTIVCQTVGLNQYSSALGLMLMFRGITSLSAPPIMGAIRDITLSFNIPFIIAGTSFIISALMHFYLMRIINQINVNEKSNDVNV